MVYNKEKRYPIKIIYYPIQEVNFLNRNCLKFSNVKLQFNGNTIDENIFFIKGIIEVSGDEDLKMADDELMSLVLPSEYEWVTAEVEGTNSDIKVNKQSIENNTLQINSPLIKRDEGLLVSAFLKVDRNSNDKAENIITLKQHLQNVKCEKPKLWNGTKPSKKKLIRKIILSIVFWLYLAIFTLLEGFFQTDRAIFYVNKVDASTYYYPYVTLEDNGIYIQERNKFRLAKRNKQTPLTVDEFYENYIIAEPQPHFSKFLPIFFFTLAGISIIGLIISIIDEIIHYNKSKRIYTLAFNDSKDYDDLPN